MIATTTKQKNSTRAALATIKDSNVFCMPVAPQLVARTRFSPVQPLCGRSWTVAEALALLRETTLQQETITLMAAISGPGDPLATPDITLHAVRQIKKLYPELKIGIRTLGMGSEKLAGELAKAGADYIELQVDALRAEVLEKLYAWIRPGQKTLKISQAAKILIQQQRHGVPALKFHNLTVCIRSTLYPGYNLNHVSGIGREMQELGADTIALVPYSFEPGTEVDLASPTTEEVEAVSGETEKYLPITGPLINSRNLTASISAAATAFSGLAGPTEEKPNVAVTSSDGMEVNLHLGHADRFLIYGPRDDGLPCLLETRDAPEPGSGKARWEEAATILSDCFALLTASAGDSPKNILSKEGVTVVLARDNIEGTVDRLYYGDNKKKNNKEQ
ncbi:NifB/NifX family molybdenum-iron cluster-binding protein [Desulforhopalus singaporensis]|uniref:Nitrogen fixation protein NifB n=1 Tax=Desulforhopalus singaporensis TaxID=91360 RepID=A0A1H0Q757_9BACT|nr:NifB/NifX family molybdenum-iron cluster-binding protein [Desulforhopalus singaporensis]SDP12865.1 nitrogen fixation protein NifB [Desulforhopalus singaporensis]